jgi:hypothetical protein
MDLGVPSHPPITAVAVFSTTPIDHVHLSPLRLGEFNTKWYTLPLIYVDTYSHWFEYRVRGWSTTFPDGLLENSGCESMRNDSGEYPRATFFEGDDCYGYYRDNERIGYSVGEGNCFFVNYLCQPLVWSRENHIDWSPAFKREAFQILLCCKRLGGAWRNLATLLIEQLAQLQYTSSL